MVVLWIVGVVLILLGFAYVPIRKPEKNGLVATTALVLVLSGLAAVVFQFTSLFENVNPSKPSLVALSVIGLLVIVFGIILLITLKEPSPITVYGVQVSFAVLLVPLGVVVLLFPYTPLYRGGIEPGTANFTTPVSGSRFPAYKEFEVAGEVHNLPKGYTLWLLVTSPQKPNENFYFSTYQPLVVADGQTASSTKRFSDIESYGSIAVGMILYVAVQADRDCDKQIRDTISDPANSDRILQTLPPGCQVIGELELQIIN